MTRFFWIPGYLAQNTAIFTGISKGIILFLKKWREPPEWHSLARWQLGPATGTCNRNGGSSSLSEAVHIPRPASQHGVQLCATKNRVAVYGSLQMDEYSFFKEKDHYFVFSSQYNGIFLPLWCTFVTVIKGPCSKDRDPRLWC